MITISEPVDKLTCNLIKGLRTLINSNDANTVNRLSYPGTVEVTLVERVNIQEHIYLEYLGWVELESDDLLSGESGRVWRFSLVNSP